MTSAPTSIPRFVNPNPSLHHQPRDPQPQPPPPPRDARPPHLHPQASRRPVPASTPSPVSHPRLHPHHREPPSPPPSRPQAIPASTPTPPPEPHPLPLTAHPLISSSTPVSPLLPPLPCASPLLLPPSPAVRAPLSLPYPVLAPSFLLRPAQLSFSLTHP
ncbi:hypothetical protein Fmac_009354 [Flemingia macrophylla]|uniref:Uncharacterized protein n=1 Tax=Flemingia macrophylla TaxID=520843 RepID=A0ABD1N037_9FABA